MNLIHWDLAAGWREVAPRSDAPGFLIEEAGRLRSLNSEFVELHDFGTVGPVDCPIAYDAEKQLAFRYTCAAGYQGRDFSQLCSYDLRSGAVSVLADLPLNRWALWLLEWIERGGAADAGRLFGLMATDRPADDRIVIEHQLFVLVAGESTIRQRPLCRDAYRPLDFSRRRRELLFSGAEGIYLVGLQGERKATLQAQICPSGQGGSFEPSGRALVALVATDSLSGTWSATSVSKWRHVGAIRSGPQTERGFGTARAVPIYFTTTSRLASRARC